MRLFIAIDVPEDVSKYLVGIQKKVSKVRSKINYVKHFHITLKFLGEVDDVDSVKEKLRQVRFERFKLILSKVGVFPDTGLIRVVWVGTNNYEKLKDLHDQIEKSLDDFEDRDFKGHITLGRVKFIKNRKDFRDYLDTIKVESLSFDVDAFKLYKSTLTPEGPEYEVLEEYGVE
ncbi:RNA 2',3'-cyclic phosphodiesterase [Candidatus Woesearchaeota archaeon]|nr:RNA 2',3'-cyclic phosphodiesterase [Candidatus Woesearchaeota archaeon]